MGESKPFHSLSIDQTFEYFETSKQGLSDEEVKKRQNLFGKNCLEETEISPFSIFVRQFKNIPVYILLAASLVSISIGEWVDFSVVMGIIFLNGVLGFFQEMKALSSIAALKKMTESKSWVIRNGSGSRVVSSDLVPGDYVNFHEGEVVTADVRLTNSSGLMIDESSLTGESVPSLKNHEKLLPEESLPFDLSNMLLSGTIVVRGSGSGIVVKTGEKTYFASIADKAKEASPKTPLNKALDIFMQRFIYVLIAIFIFIAILGILQGRNWIDLSYILLAGLVSAVPEGLIVVVTLVMVLGAIALSKKKTLIRYLPSVETLGSVTILASDKTGTITEGKLVVKEICTENIEQLKILASLCNDAFDEKGDPLDVALLKWVKNYQNIRDAHPRVWEHPFDTRLMLMATVNKMDGSESLLVKGAYEALKEKAENPDAFASSLTSFLDQGLRVIAFGLGKWEKNTDPSSWKIRLIGLIGFLDPPKEGVREAVVYAKRAGIHVLMITGDHPETAKAIAKDVAIWTKKNTVINGREIDKLSDETLLNKLKKSAVLARVLPEHKYRIIKLLQQSKEIIAVTGDGVNDVPALKIADIGIAMGSGAEAAKSVSRMIITDNNLKVIVEAIRNARIISGNIRKVIYYLVGTTVLEVVLIVLAVLSNLPLPLLATQILWINLIGDGVQDKTFPFAKEEGNVMMRRPRRPDRQFFDLPQVIRIFFFGVLGGLFCFFIYVYLIGAYESSLVSTIIFTCVVVAQWANGIQAQKETEPFFKNVIHSFAINPWIYLGIGVGIILQCTVIYWTPELFHLVPMDATHWIYPVATFSFTFIVIEARKWVEFLFPDLYRIITV